MRAVTRTRVRPLLRRDFVLRSFIFESIKEGLGASLPPGSYSPDIYLSTFSADGEVDAAEIDKEIISARLKQDVLEHAGKLHLFVADSVSTFS